MFADVTTHPDADARVGRRRVVNINASVHDADTQLQRLRVSDLSASGCRLQDVAGLSQLAEVWVKLAGLLPMRARVMWQNGDEAGCEFIDPLSESDLASLLPPPGTIARKKLFTKPRPGLGTPSSPHDHHGNREVKR
jgi:hypothetical protein